MPQFPTDSVAAVMATLLGLTTFALAFLYKERIKDLKEQIQLLRAERDAARADAEDSKDGRISS